MKKKSKKVKNYILSGKQKKRLKFVREFVTNMELSRMAMAKAASGKGEEDVDEECGYPDHISFRMYKRMYRREGIAKRVVALLPNECWGVKPWVFETEKVGRRAETDFEKVYERLESLHNFQGKLRRADEVSRLGEYGILLIGIDDGRDLSRPIDGLNEDGLPRAVRNPKPRKLLYLMPFDQGEAKIGKMQEDEGSLRFGKPLYYELRFSDPKSPAGLKGTTQRVHWSRVIHIADNCTTSDIFGHPAQEPCYNYLLNIRKTLGGSAEMFWKGGFPGLALEGLQDAEIDKKSIAKEMEPYMARLRRYLAVENMTVKSLAPNIENPQSHIDAQIQAICISINVPKRKFMGSEEARMASIMDDDAWNKQIHARQMVHCEPNELRPFVDRLLVMRVLPPLQKPVRGLINRLELGPKYFVQWPDLYAISQKDQADVTGVLVKALSEYVTSGASRIFPPLEFLTMIMNYTTDQAEEIVAAAEKEAKKQDSGKSITISPLELAAAGKQMMPGGNGQLPPSQRTPRKKNPIKPVQKGRTSTRKRGRDQVKRR